MQKSFLSLTEDGAKQIYISTPVNIKMKCYLVTDGGREEGNILIILIHFTDVPHINLDYHIAFFCVFVQFDALRERKKLQIKKEKLKVITNMLFKYLTFG